MAQNADQIYKTKADIVSELLSALLSRIPDANTGPDSIWRIWIEMMANTAEGLYLGQQLLHNDMFIQTMNAVALMRAGEQYGREQKAGTIAVGTARFSGAGGTYIGLGSVVSAPRPATEDSLDFATTASGTIPNPGTPTACVAADNGAGAMAAGTYEYGITFLTLTGESEIGPPSNSLIQAINHRVNLTAIAVGGPGTTKRRIYRRVNGGLWGFLADIADNVTVIYADNIVATGGGTPPDDSTAESIDLAAQASEAGSDYNVAIGTITDLSDVPQGVSDVINLSAFTGGSDPEGIEQFRTALLEWVRAPMSGADADLKVWAESVDGVESATVFPNTTIDPNLLTLNEASVETSVADWANSVNATLVQSATQAADGTQSLRMTAIAAGDMAAVLAVSKTVVPGQTYTGLAQFRSAVTGRQVQVGLQWRDAGDVILSTQYGNQLTDLTTAFTQVALSAVAPAGAVKLRLVVYVVGAVLGEQHYVDKMLLTKGVITSWTPGATVLNPAPGHSTIRISGPGGSIPPQGVIDAVLALLLSHDLANISIHVATFAPHNIDVTVDVTTLGTFTLGDVTPSVDAAITDYINSVPVGGTVYKSGVLSAVFNLPGISNVTTTFADITVAATEKPVANVLTVT